MRILAIDPGPAESAWVVLNGTVVVAHNKQPNDQVLNGMRDPANVFVANSDLLAVEMIACYGMAVGAEVFDTCVWIGRFVEAWARPWGRPHRLVKRMECKMHLCHKATAKDGNIRMAILDRYGGEKAAKGRKASPGPLFGISGDVWAALAVGITATETPAK